MCEEATKTIQTRLHVAPGEQSWLHDARFTRDIQPNHPPQTARVQLHRDTKAG